MRQESTQKTDHMEIAERIVPALLNWYERAARVLPWRENKDPYRIWISEIMLQQTRVDTVIPYYQRFLSVYPDVNALAAAEEEQLMKCWEGLGYYMRARNLQKAARQIVSEYGGVFPDHFEEIRALPGIGDYTAGAIASIAFERPCPAVDGNVLRVLSRVMADSRDIMRPETRKSYMELLRKVYPADHCGDFTQSLMELGAIVCTPGGIPRCGICPLKHLCRAHSLGTELDFPMKSSSKERTVEERTVFLLVSGGRVLVSKRTAGLLGGMWQFPNVLSALSEDEARAVLQDKGCRVRKIAKQTYRKHIFSHVEWRMTVYLCHLTGTDCGFEGEWVTGAELRDRIMLPTAFKKLLPFLPDKNIC